MCVRYHWRQLQQWTPRESWPLSSLLLVSLLDTHNMNASVHAALLWSLSRVHFLAHKLELFSCTCRADGKGAKAFPDLWTPRWSCCQPVSGSEPAPHRYSTAAFSGFAGCRSRCADITSCAGCGAADRCSGCADNPSSAGSGSGHGGSRAFISSLAAGSGDFAGSSAPRSSMASFSHPAVFKRCACTDTTTAFRCLMFDILSCAVHAIVRMLLSAVVVCCDMTSILSNCSMILKVWSALLFNQQGCACLVLTCSLCHKWTACLQSPQCQLGSVPIAWVSLLALEVQS